MDVLRRAAGAVRPGRWWDRSMWFCCLGVAMLGIGIGGSALADQLASGPVTATVLSCRTELHAYGRWPGSRTTCDVRTANETTTVETEAWHPPGRALSLRRIGDTVFDPAHKGDDAWWLPGGLAIGALTWWIGFPPRTDLAYGRHAAPRPPRALCGGRHRGTARSLSRPREEGRDGLDAPGGRPLAAVRARSATMDA